MLGRIKKVNGKKKESKQGVVLVTILFILAIALIFIMSALMLTTATRTRLYAKAEDNQARLTVTAAAESFYQALYMQEITDTQLMGLGGSSIRLVCDGIPGMSGGDADNMTWAYFTKKSDNTMVIDFKTTIGDQTECVQMVLDYVEPAEPANNFAHMLNVSKGGSINRVNVGMTVASAGGTGVRHDATNNTLVFRGYETNSFSNEGQNHYFSDVIATGSFSPRDSNFYGDLVFWGNTSSYDMTKNTTTHVTMNGGSVYFLGNEHSFTRNGSAVSASNMPNEHDWFKGSGNIVFYDPIGQTVYFDRAQNNGQSASITFTKSAGTTFTGGGVPEATRVNSDAGALGKAASMLTTDYTETVYSPAGNDLLTWYGVALENGWATGAGSVPASAESVPGSVLSGGGTLAPKTYTLSGTMGNGSDMPKIVCDLGAGNYVFYITSTFTIKSGYFDIINGAGSPNNVFFIVCTGQQFQVSTINTGNGALAGIVCENCYKGDGSSDPFNYYRNYANVDGSSVPHCFIYGMGNGGDDTLAQVHVGSNGNGVINAYLGLYPSSAGADDDGLLYLTQGESCFFYGRVTCAGVKINGGGNIKVPYCPEPGADKLSNKPQEKYSDYTIYDYQYYTE